MLTPAEHYAEAERLLADIDDYVERHLIGADWKPQEHATPWPKYTDEQKRDRRADAQVHATLATAPDPTPRFLLPRHVPPPPSTSASMFKPVNHERVEAVKQKLTDRKDEIEEAQRPDPMVMEKNRRRRSHWGFG